MTDVRFYTMSDADNFFGVVAMVKSLRIQGHHDPVTVLDLGLAPAQRAALRDTVEVVQLAETVGRHPFFLGPFPFLLHPEGTAVYIDADIIVTRTLEPVLTAAARGMVCAAPDFLADRWFVEWQSIFGLERPPRRAVYVNAGFVAFSTDHFPDLFRRWWECCNDLSATHSWPLPRSDPVGLLDQDALNALLMSEVPEDRLWLFCEHPAIEDKESLARTKVVDRRRLVCRFEGRPTALLHWTGRPKPWEPAARHDLRRGAYMTCLRALLVAPDALPSAMRSTAPAWLRPGALNAMAMEVRFVTSSARRAARRVWRLGSLVKRRMISRCSNLSRRGRRRGSVTTSVCDKGVP